MRSGGQGFSRHPDVLEVTDEATRRPESNPLSVSPPARPHVRLSDTPRTGRAAEDVGPYHPSCPERARRVASERARRAKYPRRPRRVASERVRRAKDSRRPGAGRPNGPGARRPQAGGSQFIATGAGRHPAGQHGARGDTKARRRLRVGLHAHQSWTVLFPGWGWPGRCRTPLPRRPRRW